ncbi:MAG TPA: hypothetical protein VEP12_09375 [Candidatus Acidoferrum sp.]|jgi:hypothetical protein|nr:hypothetical protein [Candidatus Acidoferrum sp.]
MKQVLLERYGSPAEAVRCVDVPYDTARYQRLMQRTTIAGDPAEPVAR